MGHNTGPLLHSPDNWWIRFNLLWNYDPDRGELWTVLLHLICVPSTSRCCHEMESEVGIQEDLVKWSKKQAAVEHCAWSLENRGTFSCSSISYFTHLFQEYIICCLPILTRKKRKIFILMFWYWCHYIILLHIFVENFLLKSPSFLNSNLFNA